jgi:hypothetical protein
VIESVLLHAKFHTNYHDIFRQDLFSLSPESVHCAAGSMSLLSSKIPLKAGQCTFHKFI